MNEVNCNGERKNREEKERWVRKGIQIGKAVCLCLSLCLSVSLCVLLLSTENVLYMCNVFWSYPMPTVLLHKPLPISCPPLTHWIWVILIVCIGVKLCTGSWVIYQVPWKICSPPSSSHQLPITPILVVELHVLISFPCWNCEWVDILQVFGEQLTLLWVHECRSPTCPQGMVLPKSSSNSFPLSLSNSLLQCPLSLLWGNH